MIIVEEEAIVVKEIYWLYLHESDSLMDVARRITAKGIKPRRGGAKWDMATIRDILKNPTYIGTAISQNRALRREIDLIRKYASKVYKKAKYAKRRRPQDEWIAIKVPAIINTNDFEQVQEKLKKNKDLSPRNTKKPSLLQGSITCGLCGSLFIKEQNEIEERT